MKSDQDNKFIIKNKKGQVSTPIKVLFVFVILAVTAAILLGWGTGGIKKAFAGIGETYEDVAKKDCDNDGFKGEFGDDCPCIYVAKGESDPNHLGCPVGVDYAEDQRTCDMFLTDEEGVYAKECPYEDKEKCKRRCEDVEAETKGLKTESDAQGVPVKGDLEATTVNVETDSNKIQATFKDEGQLLVDFKNKEEASLSTEFTVKNVGTEDIIDVFMVSYSLCDIYKRNCQDISERSYKVSGLKKGETRTEKTPVLPVGTAGDNCDGFEEGSCYLRLKVDNDEKLNEGVEGERNNVAYVRLVFRNQKQAVFEFDKYQVTVVSGGKEGCIEGQICDYWRYQFRGTTGGYIDMESIRNWYNNPPVGTDDQYDSQWKSIPTSFPANGNCWALSEVDSLGDNELGAIVLKQETIISHITSQKFSPVLDPKVGDESAITAAVENPWKADQDGSLICSEDWWYLCSSLADKKALTVNNKKYFCCNKIWQDRACN